MMLALLLVAMLVAALNYNSNLALAFAFLMISVALVAMHHCNRNLLGLGVDASAEADAFAGGHAEFRFALRNDSGLDRAEIEVRCTEEALTIRGVPANQQRTFTVALPVPRRGITRLERFELRTRHPFGWFRAWTYVQAPLTAYAAPAPRGERPMRSAAGGVGVGGSTEARGDEDFDGLRSYQPGIPLKHMAWKVLARGGEAAVRNYTAPAAAPEWLDWSALADLDVEGRLAQLCCWVLQCEDEQRRYGLRLPGCEIAPARGEAHRTACLRALAGFGAAQ
jgi:uncharacterized protein (DUF58 family)